MKRKLITYAPLLLLLWSFLIPSQSYATHLAGADLTYAYVSSDGLGNHTYKVTFTWIRECSHGSVNLHPTETLRIKGCGGNTTVTMNRILVEDITPVCHPSYGCGQSNPFV
ncbi:MAG: hypothetical protein AB8F95_11310, partial [Bacteroidia bacterium]